MLKLPEPAMFGSRFDDGSKASCYTEAQCKQFARQPWVTYLSDCADGVKGHYAIARWHPDGYREVWNLISHRWASFSEKVLTLTEAEALLRDAVIPTAPAQPVDHLQDIAAFISVGGYNGATTEQLAQRIKDEFLRLGAQTEPSCREAGVCVQSGLYVSAKVAQPEPVSLTDERDRALCEAYFNTHSDEYFKARPQLDSDVNRRIFYAGHRKAWITVAAAKGGV